jgi:hypothetical protein
MVIQVDDPFTGRPQLFGHPTKLSGFADRRRGLPPSISTPTTTIFSANSGFERGRNPVRTASEISD